MAGERLSYLRSSLLFALAISFAREKAEGFTFLRSLSRSNLLYALRSFDESLESLLRQPVCSYLDMPALMYSLC